MTNHSSTTALEDGVAKILGWELQKGRWTDAMDPFLNVTAELKSLVEFIHKVREEAKAQGAEETYKEILESAEAMDKANSLIRFGDNGMIAPKMEAMVRNCIAVSKSGSLTPHKEKA